MGDLLHSVKACLNSVMLFPLSAVGGTMGHVTEEVTFVLLPTGTVDTQNCDWWKSLTMVYFEAAYLSLLKYNVHAF